MFPKSLQVNRAAQKRSDNITAQRGGNGTFDPTGGSYGSQLKSGVPGVQTPRNMRETAERRASQTIPGFGSQTTFSSTSTPGSGQR